MNIETKKKLLEQGLDKGSYPEVLYKYRTIEQLEMILDNHSFWFASPNTFNDPFDCSLSEVDSYELGDARTHFLSIGIEERHVSKSIEMFQKDPLKLQELVTTIKDKTINNKGILSLSACHDDILMWSHYADYHQGAVIGLEVRKDLEFFLMPIKIDYRDTYEVLNYLKDPQKATIDTLKVKSSEWRYENEIRIYKDGSGLRAVNPKAIKEIRFGVKTSEESIEKIKEICAKKGFEHISFYRAKKAHGQFAVEFEIA
ncbi:DUF2971 domain-containing protein [Vibrio parahaemolyticus]|uniref:DUF2971 domain-containing protein n=1 Tax=Vibrio parahaemolyticus TaxID=670 RepID=UPI001592F1CC|nr:DUF2971 domain-containing protein [Vibrio parahaemolyticus]ELU9055020.1 DUF2971 domain-containing protein [Vibrio parahaemolyticus]